jgi:VanZ family protein
MDVPTAPMKILARYWLPPLVWMAVIWTLSSDTGSAEHTSRFFLPLLRWLAPWASPAHIELGHLLVRKLGHVVEYAVLSALWFRALRGERRLAPIPSASAAWLVSLTWAVLDEVHQSTVASRTASGVDVLVDAAGATLALLAARLMNMGGLERAPQAPRSRQRSS